MQKIFLSSSRLNESRLILFLFSSILLFISSISSVFAAPFNIVETFGNSPFSINSTAIASNQNFSYTFDHTWHFRNSLGQYNITNASSSDTSSSYGLRFANNSLTQYSGFYMVLNISDCDLDKCYLVNTTRIVFDYAVENYVLDNINTRVRWDIGDFKTMKTSDHCFSSTHCDLSNTSMSMLIRRPGSATAGTTCSIAEQSPLDLGNGYLRFNRTIQEIMNADINCTRYLNYTNPVTGFRIGFWHEFDSGGVNKVDQFFDNLQITDLDQSVTVPDTFPYPDIISFSYLFSPFDCLNRSTNSTTSIPYLLVNTPQGADAVSYAIDCDFHDANYVLLDPQLESTVAQQYRLVQDSWINQSCYDYTSYWHSIRAGNVISFNSSNTCLGNIRKSISDAPVIDDFTITALMNADDPLYMSLYSSNSALAARVSISVNYTSQVSAVKVFDGVSYIDVYEDANQNYDGYLVRISPEFSTGKFLLHVSRDYFNYIYLGEYDLVNPVTDILYVDFSPTSQGNYFYPWVGSVFAYFASAKPVFTSDFLSSRLVYCSYSAAGAHTIRAYVNDISHPGSYANYRDTQAHITGYCDDSLAAGMGIQPIVSFPDTDDLSDTLDDSNLPDCNYVCQGLWMLGFPSRLSKSIDNTMPAPDGGQLQTFQTIKDGVSISVLMFAAIIFFTSISFSKMIIWTWGYTLLHMFIGYLPSWIFIITTFLFAVTAATWIQGLSQGKHDIPADQYTGGERR